jgi:adenosylcobyric acid synthase
MMGMEVCDPHHLEGEWTRMPGLGLLPVKTVMDGDKTTRQVVFTVGDSPSMKGYEIHVGVTRTTGESPEAPLAMMEGGGTDGYMVSNKCMGTYIHGILDNAPFIDLILEPFADKIKEAGKPFDYAAFKEQQYDLLAEHVRKHLDMNKIYQILKGND